MCSCFLPPTRGQQYGEDVLPLLSDIINASTAEAQGPVAALALQGLHALCESEVGFAIHSAKMSACCWII